MSEQPLPPGTRPEGARSEEEAARAVQQMFARIVPRYDLLNHLLSFGRDRRWRERTAEAFAARLAEPDSRALDLCCGTGDLALELARRSGGAVVGSDFVHAMLVRAHAKAHRQHQRLHWVEADALALPFSDASFDVVTAAFGFRNLANYPRGLEEIHRVLKPGGEVGILEFALPTGRVFGRVYGFYFRRVLPWVGRVVSGVRGPYSYLPASVEQFPDSAGFAAWMERVGFRLVSYRLWTGGTVALYRGRK
ncbi:MAG: bifunctional demethylmenaquinone methyltransferase/2-methoxy-6-polyprenyl-1,4-benzoquinol methylase UbiE [Acidobacteria bacterium]|nr:bifunctional demethylmenaquinone methyltransferase/2-methoxy-6-polyprenyl-1,4-benzoquinol methylase UbiE [Acidobacteriota bacterium]